MMGSAELLYYAGYRVKTYFDLKRQRKLPVKVISIGNLTTGGTGKTPAVIALAGEARAMGLRPCILTRGYRGGKKGPFFVTADMHWTDTGDEPLLMARKLKDVPVVKCPDRYRAGLLAIGSLNPPPDVFILDDGFQHRKLYRDMDVLLVNALDPFGSGRKPAGRLLPVGRLREPIEQVQRADALVLTKSDGIDTEGVVGLLEKHNPSAPVFFSRHKPSFVEDLEGERRPVEWLNGRKVYGFSGIAEPAPFLDIIRGAGGDIVGSRPFRDHYGFTGRDVDAIIRAARRADADWIITTEKDIVRLGDFELPHNLLVLGIEFTVDRDLKDFLFKTGSSLEERC